MLTRYVVVAGAEEGRPETRPCLCALVVTVRTEMQAKTSVVLFVWFGLLDSTRRG